MKLGVGRINNVVVVALAAPPGLPDVPLSPGLTPDMPSVPAVPVTTTVPACAVIVSQAQSSRASEGVIPRN